MMSIKAIGKAFVFVIVGIVTITVGFFMLRGTARMWDSRKSDDDDPQ